MHPLKEAPPGNESLANGTVEVVAVAQEPLSAAPQKSLWEHASWTFLGNLIYLGCQAVWLVLISHLSSKESRGQFVIAMAAATPVITFANLGLRQMLATDVRSEHRFSGYFILRLLSTTVALIVIACIAGAQWFDDRTAALVLIAVGFAKSFESISDLVYGRMQQFERFDRIARSMIVKGTSSLVCLALGLILTQNAIGAASGIAAGFLLTLLLCDIPNARIAAQSGGQPISLSARSPRHSSPFNVTAGQLWRIVRQAAPLAFASSLVILNPNIVMYLTRAYLGNEQVGVLGSLNSLPMVGSVLVSALGVAVSTRLATYYSQGELRAFYRLLLRSLMLCFALALIGILASILIGKWVLALLYRIDDEASVHVLIWLMISAGISYLASILGYAVTTTRIFHRFTVPYLLVTVVAVLASLVLIPRFDLRGAAWASGAINLACCVAPLFILTRLHFESGHGTAARTTR